MLLLAAPIIFLFAATQDPGDLTGWLTGSAVTVLAFGVVAFTRGWIVPGPIHDRVVAERDEFREELRRIAREDREALSKVVTESTDSLISHLQRRQQGGGQ